LPSRFEIREADWPPPSTDHLVKLPMPKGAIEERIFKVE